jgi:hypothetical protein
MSNRKPYNDRAGYVASKRSGTNKGHVVIYLAEEADLDATQGKYAVSCEMHNTIAYTSSLPKARTAMKSVCFCEECTTPQTTF